MSRANSTVHSCNTLISICLVALVTSTAYWWTTSVPSMQSMSCRVDGLGWFGTSSHNITIYDTSTRRLLLSCLDIQREASRRIMNYRSWQLNTAIRRRETIRRARDALVLVPFHVADSLAATIMEVSTLLKTVATTASSTARVFENTASILSKYTIPIIGLLLSLGVIHGASITCLRVPRCVFARIATFLKKVDVS